jgi:error-prone DNA polymerase
MTEPYAELHAHSNFSFLDGASHPEELAIHGAALGLSALALTDHNGLYGVVRFAQAAKEVALATVFGAEVSLGAGPRTGTPDPQGRHLVILAKDPLGYASLSAALANAHLESGRKGQPVLDLSALADAHRGHWMVLTGCRKGPLAQGLMNDGPAGARRALEELIEVFGRDSLAVEIWDHGDPLDSVRNDALSEIGISLGVEPVATNNVHYAKKERFPLASVLAAVRARQPLEELAGWLPAASQALLRTPAEQQLRFSRWPGVLRRSVEIAQMCAFDLSLVAPQLPKCVVPDGHDEQSWLAYLVEEKAPLRYGPRDNESVKGAWARLDHELSIIGQLGYAGYFLIVYDLVSFARSRDILCQGRGSAATSAVCFVLGITLVDAVRLNLVFERFLSPAREGPPDIDVDIESGRREEVIQYVYERYGRRHAAQVANVITYRPRSAIRDVAKALGMKQNSVEALIKKVGYLRGNSEPLTLPQPMGVLVQDLLGFPRHLGIHSGGMVLCDRPLVEVCPVEPATMPNRTILQWDKDDCASVGLVKFDLLGLGMLEAMHNMIELIRSAYGIEIDLGALPQEDAVYDLLCKADTVGVFQVESRAQMGTLPRVEPRNFYDLAIEVALIRPGPIQGNAVHPYIRRRRGDEPVTYLHPSMKPALERTLGVPLFQEQLMQLVVEVAGFSATDADELRQAMSHKRSDERMQRLRDRLFAGMAAKGITPEIASQLYDSLAAFARFGFPESHALSFAGLVYSSAWMKLHYPAAFVAGLLNAQPMGFWSPQSLLADAKRHGVSVHRPDVNLSAVGARVVDPDPKKQSEFDPSRPSVRLGLGSIRGIGQRVAERIVEGAPWASQEDLVRRGGLKRTHLEVLALSGALDALEPQITRRGLLWKAGAAAQSTPDRLAGIVSGAHIPQLFPATPLESVADDLWALGVTPEKSAMELARPWLDANGVLAISALDASEGKVRVAGVVTHRQAPETAKGAVFLNLEDETGMVNVVCSKGAWQHFGQIAGAAPVLIVRGRLERGDGALNIVAEKVTPLTIGPVPSSRNYR